MSAAIPRREAFAAALRTTRFGTALAGVVGAVLLMLAWVVATPVGSAADEPAHIIYAYGVATDQVLPWSEQVRVQDGVPQAAVRLPSALFDYPAVGCYRWQSAETVTCPPTPVDGTWSDAESYMVRYPPLYYAVIGTVLRAGMHLGLSGAATLVAARVVSGVLGSVLLLLAARALCSRFPAGAALPATLAASSPVAVHLIAAINPNGFEVAAAVAAAAMLVAVRKDVEDGRHVRVSTRVALVSSVVLLAGARPLSVAWAGLLVLLLIPRAGSARPLARIGWVAAGALVATLAVAAGWVAYAAAFRGSDAGVGTEWGESPVPTRLLLILLKFGELLEDAVAGFGWGETRLPVLLVIVSLVAPVVLVVAQSVGARGRRVLAVPAVAFLVLGSGVVAAHSYVAAFGWQGRYWLPVLAASLVLCVPAMQSRALDARGVRRVVLGTAVPLLVVHGCAVLWNMWRYAYGVGYLEGRFPAVALPMGEAGWEPLGGQGVVVGLAVAGVTLLALPLVSVVSHRSAALIVPSPQEPS